MVICKYFLQGTCRFGNNCKFDHQLGNDHSYANATSVLVQNYSSKPAQATSNIDTNTLVKAVVNDMTSAEKGGQWLLSSYAPFKDKPAFPGFEDHSMEEVRYLFYESMKSGNIEPYKQNLQIMLQQAILKIKALQNPVQEAVNMLKTIYNTPPSSSLNTNQPAFNTAPGNSVFANPQPQQKSIFGNPPTNQNQNMFTGVTSPVQNVFAGGANNSIFGGQTPNTSVFANQPQNQTKSIFAGPQQTAPSGTSIFGQNPIFPGGAPTQPIFPNQQNPNFGPPNQQIQPQNGPFAQAGPQSPFGVNAQPNLFQQQNAKAQYPNQFGVPQTTSPQFGPPEAVGNQFVAAQPVNNPFAAAQTVNQYVAPQGLIPSQSAKPAFQHTQSIFGNLGLQANTNNVFGGAPQAKPNEEFYSKLEDLTEEEIRWFQSDDLDVGKIPEKPPTYEMCFKVQ